jgi:hypothetical protein
VEDRARGGGPGRIVVVGASAGGAEALIGFVRGPGDAVGRSPVARDAIGRGVSAVGEAS